MSLNALVLTRDKQALSVLAAILQAVELHVEGCFSAGETMVKLQKNKYDAILIDCTSVPDAGDVVEALRQGRSNRKAIAFAITDDPQESQRAFKAGANFIIEKPLTAERVTRSLRAAHGLIVRERRRYTRLPIDAVVTIEQGDSQPLRWNMLDVSEGGLGAIVPDRVAFVPSGAVRIRFKIPTGASIEGKAEIVWNRTGKVGMQFTFLQPQSRVDLDKWIAKRFDESQRMLIAKQSVVLSARR